MDYKQPDFYRFNEDSIQLINLIKSHVKNAENILDLGAGSGVIGIELARHFKPLSVDFVEIQPSFEEYIKENINLFLENINNKIYIKSFLNWIPEKKYDLVVSNPPYYLPNRGQASKDKRRQICRSFEIDTWKTLLQKLHTSLSPFGTGFIVLKKDPFLMQELFHNIAEERLTVHLFEQKNLLMLRLNKNRNEDSF